jgi:small conductance mechanosensitive channel
VSCKADIPTRLAAPSPAASAVSVVAKSLRGFSAAIVLLVMAMTAHQAGPANAQTEDAAVEESAAPPISPILLQPDIPIEELAFRLVPLTRDELGTLSQEWLQIVRETTLSIANRQAVMAADPALRTDEASAEIARLVEVRASLFERYTMVVDAFERKGGDPAMVDELRAYRNAVLFDETALASPRAIAIAFFTWLTRTDGGLGVVFDLGIVLLAIVVLLFVAAFARRLARRSIGRVSHLSRLLQAFLVTFIYWLVLVVGLLVVLAVVGVNVAPAFAMIGGASFILAFAFQDTLGNLASGLMIMINRPFDEGDYVLVGGVGGTVDKVSIVATTVITPDNQVIVIPNKNVWGNVITNVTASDTRRVDLVFGISYEDSIEEAERVMREVVTAHPLVIDDPEPTIRVHELAASSVNFVCRPWTRTSDYWTVYWDLTHQMKDALKAAGISIPYPQRDIHIRTQGA